MGLVFGDPISVGPADIGSVQMYADRRRAHLKCKLLTGSYILQGNRAVFNQCQVDPTCKLCSATPETRQHFLAECPVFETERDSFKQKMCNNLLLQDCRFHDLDVSQDLF